MLSLTLVCSLTFHVVVKWWSSCLPAEKVSRVSVISSARYAQGTLAPRSSENSSSTTTTTTTPAAATTTTTTTTTTSTTTTTTTTTTSFTTLLY